jgi:hypothetical protein
MAKRTPFTADQTVPASYGETVVMSIPSTRLRLIESAGHYSPLIDLGAAILRELPMTDR